MSKWTPDVDTSCGICLVSDRKPMWTLPCGHGRQDMTPMHVVCLADWFKYDVGKTCPICRTAYPPYKRSEMHVQAGFARIM